MLALWLQFDNASSAATGVAILAQPKRGQGISKAVYRFIGTVMPVCVGPMKVGCGSGLGLSGGIGSGRGNHLNGD